MCGVQHALPKSFLAGFAFLQVRDAYQTAVSQEELMHVSTARGLMTMASHLTDTGYRQPCMIKTILGFCS